MPELPATPIVRFGGINPVATAARPESTERPLREEIMNQPNPTPPLPNFAGAGGLLPAIAQDAQSGQVLMLAWMNEQAFNETLATGRAVYFSRSRGRLWYKGEESGNIQHVESIMVDCDGDTILLKVRQIGGAACHEGYPSCFFRQITAEGIRVAETRVFDPAKVYKKPHE
jgi:phosphoribosyl-AMP cyclohydrolase